MNKHDAELEAEQEAIEEARIVDESNLAGHFNMYGAEGLARLVAYGEKIVMLDDGDNNRLVSLANLSLAVARCEEFSHKLMFESIPYNSRKHSLKLVEDELMRLAFSQITEIEQDYQDLLRGDL